MFDFNKIIKIHEFKKKLEIFELFFKVDLILIVFVKNFMSKMIFFLMKDSYSPHR